MDHRKSEHGLSDLFTITKLSFNANFSTSFLRLMASDEPVKEDLGFWSHHRLNKFWRPKLKELVFTKTINGVKDNDEELAIIDLDASGLPLVSIVQKPCFLHSRWQVFQGDNTNENNLLFTIKKRRVLLAVNTEEVEWDFKITEEYRKRSIQVVHERDPTFAIAEMSQHHRVKKVRLANDAFGVTINPNMDYAFIVSLFCILHLKQLKQDTRQRHVNEFAEIAADLATTLISVAVKVAGLPAS
ncbi:protein LURP-one-related 8-like [Dioscorea cayenensis subsp. rotundata]|uniref:Protein LURP-one-related 8-like n=1 Tax=Dioscorea cayennensis subsp. rotundata TaxID=55577 RepID=A0AB40B9H9_DIOCR|nr:protein LURP-one-related 8-like [Dioscorea cayenensis subsp. rotundata]